MNPSRRLALVMAMLSAVSGTAFAQAKGAQPIGVSDAKQLVNAIGPNRTIVLKKGDYRLSSAYGVSNKYATWNKGDDGAELSIVKVENLTIRGADGARILSDSGFSSIIGIYGSKNVSLDNLRFVRLPKKVSDVGAGSFYAEAVEGLTLDRCSFEGPTTIAIELWECADVAIKRGAISGAVSGALALSNTRGFAMSSTRVSMCEGYPLLYIEESDGLLFKGSTFDGTAGGNFIEIYAESGGAESIRFDGCTFKRNQVEYFAGSSILPSVEGCEFADNSFDENWKLDSVAPASDDSYYYGDEGEEALGPQWYDHPSGLSFSYPPEWTMEEYPAQSRVGLFAPDSKSLVFFLTAYALPVKVDPSKQAKKVFADAYAALARLLKEETGIALAMKADGEPYTDNDILSADYRGIATKGDGENAEARARLMVWNGGVHAMVGFAADAASLGEGGDIDDIFGSVEILVGEN